MSEKKYIVTIARQFGSLGRPIAMQMSKKLGVEFYDRDIVEEIETKRRWLEVKNIIENYVTKCLQNQFVLIRYKHTILSCHIKQKSVQIN